MHLSSALLTGALVVGVSAESNYLGFNTGATFADRSAKFTQDFIDEMKTARDLAGAPGTFNSMRLYTCIQAYSEDDPIQAIPAAIATNTNLLLGIWASGTDNINKEIRALQKAVDQYGTNFTNLVIAMSLGSEDLYRDSETGIKNKGGVGASPDTIVNFIKEYKKAFAGNALSKVPIGHVDTWDAWTNTSNKAVLDAVDWVGVDEYPFYEGDKGNKIENAGVLFDKAYDATVAIANGKPVWVTETGWPTTGPNWVDAVPSVDNAKTFWQEVGCRRLFNKTPTFWYTLRDSNPDNKVKFAITDNLSTKPYFDLTCPKTFKTNPQISGGSSTTTAKSTGTDTSNGVTKPTTSGSSGSSGSGSSGSGSSGSGSNGSGSSGSGSSGNGSSSTTTTTPGASPSVKNAAAVNQLSGAAYFVLAGLAGYAALP